MAHAELGAVKKQGGQRGAHALRLRVLIHVLADRRISVFRRRAEQGQHVVIARITLEGGHVLHHGGGSDLAGGVATHAVGQHQQVRASVGGILIVFADQSAVCHCSKSQA